VIISITGGEDMRLMEVDEAASHIKELVDPDANIIWGSAFNNDLGGKIRVSVVATGIEAEIGVQPQPAKVFSFPTRTVASTPASAPELVETASDEEIVETGSTTDEGDELLLDSDDILTSPVGGAPIAPPEDEDDTPATAGGTLFERMSNIARGAPKAQVDDEGESDYRRDPIDIPRFLNRQNNQ
ncbi:MAG TPA: cell division protein FtsZ, partial [Sphingomicrobium sp.]|nr:cell division protein FtsZ [Sphingomicrobium sp.]